MIHKIDKNLLMHNCKRNSYRSTRSKLEFIVRSIRLRLIRLKKYSQFKLKSQSKSSFSLCSLLLCFFLFRNLFSVQSNLYLFITQGFLVPKKVRFIIVSSYFLVSQWIDSTYFRTKPMYALKALMNRQILMNPKRNLYTLPYVVLSRRIWYFG